MKKYPEVWIAKFVIICLFLGALINDVSAKEQIKAPLLTGKIWVNMSPDQKSSYIWGVGDIIDLEQEIMEIYPELKRDSFVSKAVEGIGDVPIKDIVANVDSFYNDNPDKIDLSVIRVIWDVMIKPNIKTGIAGKPLR
ncbi:MAG: hypothetical protein PVF37_07700 [Desulfobacterales bacterium]|jgi:hypothetical protein